MKRVKENSKVAMLVAMFAMVFTTTAFAQEKGTFTDSRDGKKYGTVKIGEEIWMAQNLDYHGSDGFFGLCYGDVPRNKIRKPENCKKYGRLYDWAEAMKACPAGWHLPSDKEWQTLVDFAGGNEVAAKKLKAKNGWPDELDNRGRYTYADDFGFSAQPGGYFDVSKAGYFGFWWTAKGYNDLWGAQASYFTMGYDNSKVIMDRDNQSNLLSVRCIKDEDSARKEARAKAEAEAREKAKASSGTFTDSRDKKTYKTVKINGKTWMAENLNYEVKNFLAKGNSKCYNDDPANCIKYGRLYNLDEAMKACPKGWHLPSSAEWDILLKYADSNWKPNDYEARSKVAGTKLNAKNGWDNNGSGMDEFGFAALPGGVGNGDDGRFHSAGSIGRWWSRALENGNRYALYIEGEYARWSYDDFNSDLISVRCLQD
jgi:uncharacterized protein (TIGR02145 family)